MTNLAISNVVSASYDKYEWNQDKKIFRAQHNKENPYTLISNKLLRDTRIRHSDRGLMAQLLSWSDHHSICIKALVKKSVEGRDSIRGMLDRLIIAGYIRMQQKKSADGRFDQVVYQIFEESTGTIVADLDLTGIVKEDECLGKPQLDLFECELNIMDEENESVNLAADGKAVNGKPETNNNNDLRNTNFNSNKGQFNFFEKETKESLLKKWHLNINDSQVNARLGMAGLSTFITKQEELDRYLIDFNQQHEKYKHLSNTQRLKNFTAYLVRVKHTPVEYAKHIARMKLLGFEVYIPIKRTVERKSDRTVNVNPFEVKMEKLENIPEFNILVDGF